MTKLELYVFSYKHTDGLIYPISFRIPGDDEASPFIAKDKTPFNIKEIQPRTTKRLENILDCCIIIPILFEEETKLELYFLSNLIKINFNNKDLYLPKYDLLLTNKHAIQENKFNSVKINSFDYKPTMEIINLNESFLNTQKNYLLDILTINEEDYNLVYPTDKKKYILEDYTPNIQGLEHLKITRNPFTLRIYNSRLPAAKPAAPPAAAPPAAKPAAKPPAAPPAAKPAAPPAAKPAAPPAAAPPAAPAEPCWHDDLTYGKLKDYAMDRDKFKKEIFKSQITLHPDKHPASSTEECKTKATNKFNCIRQTTANEINKYCKE